MVVDGDAQEVTLPDTAGPDLGARADRIELTRVAAVSAGSMLLDDDQSVAWNAELDTLLSTGLDDDQADAELADIAGEANAVVAQVSVPETVHVHADRPVEPAAPEHPQLGHGAVAGRRQPELGQAHVPRGTPARASSTPTAPPRS